MLRRRGVTYDTGFFPAGVSSRPHFAERDVREDMAAVARELRCDAVRITGGDIERLIVAARIAANEGLEVWLSPQPCELDLEETRNLLLAAANAAAGLSSAASAEVVLVLGCELSVFAEGLIPGEDCYARMQALLAPTQEMAQSHELVASRLNHLLRETAAQARTVFGGRVTYASGPWEPVDWTPFDIVSVDAYRDGANATVFRDQIRSLHRFAKPVAVTEFGCCTYRGAADRGGYGWAILGTDGTRRVVVGDYVRDEGEQARYLTELFRVFEEEGVDSAFWFTFANYDKPRGGTPETDLDLASFGVVAALDPASSNGNVRWVPKQAFRALAEVGSGAPALAST
jgi:hypothetical protein